MIYKMLETKVKVALENGHFVKNCFVENHKADQKLRTHHIVEIFWTYYFAEK